ncbi:putative N-acetylated-alpha-linked acidic dipeptidase isoform X1 [Macrobrachium rosenbergii]|uniref:putative N-acetylated-alpha-linked acidic dipeptidase isoform X1 n=2 Tax=Macrobrachium rosenbergii TaxID=79674 RepID=UPI0034D6E230
MLHRIVFDRTYSRVTVHPLANWRPSVMTGRRRVSGASRQLFNMSSEDLTSVLLETPSTSFLPHTRNNARPRNCRPATGCVRALLTERNRTFCISILILLLTTFSLILLSTFMPLMHNSLNGLHVNYESPVVLGRHHKKRDIQLDPENVILQETSGDAILETLRYLTSEPHTAGTEADTRQAKWVAQVWTDQGLDTVNLIPYTVLLSYPDREKNNTVKIIDDRGKVRWMSHCYQTPLGPGEDHPDVFQNFNAYSAPGEVVADIVYAYLGREEDYDYLQSQNVSVNGSIVLTRYGDIFRANQVLNAEVRGAAGVLLYSDPASVCPDGCTPNVTYPNTIYNPMEAVQLGTTYLNNGDPLTPFRPSIDSAFRIPEEEAAIPKIPVQPISYTDAQQIFKYLGGERAPDEWQGGLDSEYRLGPGLRNPSWTTQLSVHTSSANASIFNVIGTITGVEEPDRYVILGNHRDAWIFGGVDPSSATAALLEVTRLFSQLVQRGWRPRRTLIFCSWGAEEYGLVGSTEWTEQFSTHLQHRAVAYLNVDMVFEGTYSFKSMASPLLYGPIIRATQKVPNPDDDEVLSGRPYLFDTWLFKDRDPVHETRPKFFGLGSGSDFTTFQHVLGIPCSDMMYSAEPDTPSLPLYHTLYETLHLAVDLYDPVIHFQTALTQAWALVALELAQEPVIPFTVDLYGEFVKEAFLSIKKEYGSVMSKEGIELDYFEKAVEEFFQATQNWTLEAEAIDPNNVLALRAFNDAQMLVDRSFIDPRGLPGRPEYNHVVTAPSSTNTYNADSFAGLQDLLHKIEDLPDEEREKRWRAVKEHLAVITHLTQAAANALSWDLW